MVARGLPLLGCVVALGLAASVSAQPPANGADGAQANRPPAQFVPLGGPGGRGGANRFDDVKKELGASEEEWKVIMPKLQKVIAARQAADVRAEGGFGGPFMFGGPVGPGGRVGVAFAAPGGGGPGGRPGPAFQGPGGDMPAVPFGGPQMGQLIPSFMQDALRLTAEQKKQLAELQKEVDAKLDKLLTEEQRKQMERMRQPFRAPGGFGAPGFGPPGGGGPAAATAEVRDNVPKPTPPGGSDSRPADTNKGPDNVPARRPDAPSGLPIPANEGRPGPRGDVVMVGGGPMDGSPVSQAQADLKAVLGDPKHTPADVQEKIAAVRKARQKAREELEAAVKDLRQLLTAEQEAALISLGYLE